MFMTLNHNRLEVWLRQGEHLQAMSHVKGWRSPKLGIRFEVTPETLKICYPDGRPFLSSVELAQRMEQEAARAEQEHQRAEQENARAEQEAARAQQEHQRAEQASKRFTEEQQRVQRLTEQLRALSIDPEDLK